MEHLPWDAIPFDCEWDNALSLSAEEEEMICSLLNKGVKSLQKAETPNEIVAKEDLGPELLDELLSQTSNSLLSSSTFDP
nr:ethylene-responsive transcription factor 1B-like [Ipomoea trifida]